MWIAIAVVALLLAFIVWRLMSVARGARQRDEQLYPILDPLVVAFQAGRTPTREEVEGVAAVPQTRPLLYALLQDFEAQHLLAEARRGAEAHAEGQLAYWLGHPNELAAFPERIEVSEALYREVQGQTLHFFVLRFTAPAGHPEAERGWMLGIAGPYRDGESSHEDASAFSRIGDKEDQVEPDAIVDWYVDMAMRKGLPWAQRSD